MSSAEKWLVEYFRIAEREFDWENDGKYADSDPRADKCDYSDN